jgi:hypothetical protein
MIRELIINSAPNQGIKGMCFVPLKAEHLKE